MASKENIYSSIQNLYNMDKNTWQEVLAELYNLVYQCEDNNENLQTRIDNLLDHDFKEEILKNLIELKEDGSLNDIISESNKYILPIASPYTLGGVKIGANLSIDSNGVLSANNNNEESSSGETSTIISSIDVSLNPSNSYTISNNAIEETINLQWTATEEVQDDSIIFYNGATGTFPQTIPTDTALQLGNFYTQIIADSYNNKGGDKFGTIIGYIKLNVGDGDTITVENDILQDLTGNIIRTITESGYYVVYKNSISSAGSYLNKGKLLSSLGTSTIINLVMQSKPYIVENYPNFSFSVQGFVSKFPPTLIGDLAPQTSYSPSISDIYGRATINDTEITNATTSYSIKKGDVINCLKGKLSFTYRVVSSGGSQTENPTNSNTVNLSKYKWACIGDSYTDTTINADYKYCQIIGDITKIKVQYLGVGGTGWWRGYDTQTSYRFRASQVDSDTDIVTIFGSINDWKYYQGDNPLTIGSKTDSLSAGNNTLCAYINDVFDALESSAPTAQIIVFSPMYYHGLSARVPELFNALKECTENRGYEFVDMLNTGWKRIENNTIYAQTYCTDYSSTAETYGHPNNLAHKTFIAPKFYYKLLEYLPLK